MEGKSEAIWVQVTDSPWGCKTIIARSPESVEGDPSHIRTGSEEDKLCSWDASSSVPWRGSLQDQTELVIFTLA